MINNPKVVFIYDGNNIIIQCSKDEKMKDICQKYSDKIKKNISSLFFLYGGTLVNYEVSFYEQANLIDKTSNEMRILVYNIENFGLTYYNYVKNIKPETIQINRIISSINNIKNKLDGIKSFIKNIVSTSKDNSLKNQLNIIISELNNIYQDLNKSNEQINNLFNGNNSNKNVIKGTLDITMNEVNNKILLFNSDINGGIDVYLNNEKINLIKNNNQWLIDFYSRNVGKYTFEIIFNNNLTNLKCFFSECSTITSLDLSNFDTSNVTDMYRMFNKCTKLQTISGLTNLITNNVTNMSAMFQYCNELLNLDLSNFNTSKVIKMGGMFRDCKKLKEIKGIQNFITNNVTDMNSMFGDCYILEYLDLSGFKTPNVTNMKYMFNKCYKLKEIKLNNFDTSNVTCMAFMFSECYELKNIEGINRFNTEKVTEMTSMFNECYELEKLDLSKFNTSKVTSMRFMFYKCNKLRNLNLLNFEIKCGYEGIREMFSFNRKENFQLISNNKELIKIYQSLKINIS